MTTKPAKKILGSEDAPRSRFALRKKPTPVLSEEVAVDQVLDFLEYYDIDVERHDGEPGKPNPMETALKSITEYVRRGTVEVGRDEKGKIKVTINLSNGNDALVCTEIGARHKLAMDKAKGGEGYARIYALMGALTGVGQAGIEKLPARDLAVVENLGMVFLAA